MIVRIYIFNDTLDKLLLVGKLLNANKRIGTTCLIINREPKIHISFLNFRYLDIDKYLKQSWPFNPLSTTLLKSTALKITQQSDRIPLISTQITNNLSKKGWLYVSLVQLGACTDNLMTTPYE